MITSQLNSVRRLVSRIETDIAAQKAPTGSVMGTESELCSWYGVSPTIFRQAARILEASNIAAMRPGNSGGLVVYGYSLEGVAGAVTTYLEFRGADVADVGPFAAHLLAFSSRLAAERMTLESADRIRATLLAMKEAKSGFDSGMVLSHTFQQLILAANNPILSFLREVSAHFLTDATRFDTTNRRQFQRGAARADHVITAAIGGDVPRLCALMDAWTKHWREGRTSAGGRPAANDPPPEPIPGDASRTLSAQLARRILREIRIEDWPVGQRLGEEPELAAKYGVSRATFRQAVRLLEQYFAVKAKRGRGGGLFVTSPDPQRVNDLSIAALIYAGANIGHVAEARPHIAGLAFDLSLDRGEEGRDLVGSVLQRAEAEGARDAFGAFRIINNGFGQASGSRLTAFALQLLLRLEGELWEASAARAEGDRVRHLVVQCRRSFEAGDYPRAKRALIDLMARTVAPAKAEE